MGCGLQAVKEALQQAHGAQEAQKVADAKVELCHRRLTDSQALIKALSGRTDSCWQAAERAKVQSPICRSGEPCLPACGAETQLVVVAGASVAVAAALSHGQRCCSPRLLNTCAELQALDAATGAPPLFFLLPGKL